MDEVEKLMKDTYIKETIGYELFNKVPECDKDKIIEFCKIVWNYHKMDRILSNEREGLGKHECKEKVYCAKCQIEFINRKIFLPEDRDKELK